MTWVTMNKIQATVYNNAILIALQSNADLLTNITINEKKKLEKFTSKQNYYTHWYISYN